MGQHSGTWSGKQKRQIRLEQKRLEEQGIEKTEARRRADAKLETEIGRQQKGGGGRLVSQGAEKAARGGGEKQRNSKRRK